MILTKNTKNQPKRFQKGQGYTIVETMIFLAISVGLFASVIGVYSTQTRRTQFSQAVNTFDQKIRDLLNDVETGYYPLSNVKCNASGGGNITISPGSSQQGANKGCVFAGKVLERSSTAGQYHIYTLVANKTASEIDTANYKVVTFERQTESLGAGLAITNILTPPTVSHRGAISLTSFGEELAPPPNFVSGVNNRTVLATLNHSIGSGGVVTIQQDPNVTAAAAKGILVCLREQGGGRRATILIGGAARSGTTVKIDGACTF